MFKRFMIILSIAVAVLAVSSETAFARNYSPANGRFLQRDPVPMPNLYTYVSNRPTYYADPYGLQGCARGFSGRIKYEPGECCCTLRVCTFVMSCPRISHEDRSAQIDRFLTGLEQAQQIFENNKYKNTDKSAICLEFADVTWESYGQLAGGEHGMGVWDPRAIGTIDMPRTRRGMTAEQFDRMMQERWLPKLEESAKKWSQPYVEKTITKIGPEGSYSEWQMRGAAQCDINLVLGCQMLKGPDRKEYPGYAQTGGRGTTTYIGPMTEGFAGKGNGRYPGRVIGHEIGHLLGLYHPTGRGPHRKGMQEGNLSAIDREKWSEAEIETMLENCRGRQ